eukprot:g76178.t1
MKPCRSKQGCCSMTFLESSFPILLYPREKSRKDLGFLRLSCLFTGWAGLNVEKQWLFIFLTYPLPIFSIAGIGMADRHHSNKMHEGGSPKKRQKTSHESGDSSEEEDTLHYIDVFQQGTWSREYFISTTTVCSNHSQTLR